MFATSHHNHHIAQFPEKKPNKPLSNITFPQFLMAFPWGRVPSTGATGAMLLFGVALVTSFRAAAEMEVTLAEAMPGPLLPRCENQEIPLEEAGENSWVLWKFIIFNR